MLATRNGHEGVVKMLLMPFEKPTKVPYLVQSLERQLVG